MLGSVEANLEMLLSLENQFAISETKGLQMVQATQACDFHESFCFHSNRLGQGSQIGSQ